MSRQKGFTLLELLVAAAILGTVSTALTGVTFSIFRNTDDNNGRVEAVTGIEVAIHQMAEDGMAAWPSLTLPIAEGSEIIELTWIAPEGESLDNKQHRYDARYYVPAGTTDLTRQYTDTADPLGTPEVVKVTTEVLARDITGLRFDPVEGENAFNVTITSSGGGARISESREYHITLRTDPDVV